MDKKLKYLLFFLFAGLVGALNGFFGGGGGMVCVPFFKKFFSLPDKKAHASTVLVMSIVSLPTLIVYLCTLEHSINQMALVSMGSLFGGVVGSAFLNKISDKALNSLFILIIFLSAIKMFI